MVNHKRAVNLCIHNEISFENEITTIERLCVCNFLYKGHKIHQRFYVLSLLLKTLKNLHFPADNRSHCKTRKFPVRKSVLIPFRIRFDVPI